MQFRFSREIPTRVSTEEKEEGHVFPECGEKRRLNRKGGKRRAAACNRVENKPAEKTTFSGNPFPPFLFFEMSETPFIYLSLSIEITLEMEKK